MGFGEKTFILIGSKHIFFRSDTSFPLLPLFWRRKQYGYTERRKCLFLLH